MVDIPGHRLKSLRPAMPPFPPEVNIWHLSVICFINLYFCNVYTLPVKRMNL